MSYRLHNITSFEPIGSTVYHYGYKCEVKEDGAVWAEIPKELYDLELSVGRIREESKKAQAPVVEGHEQPESVAEPEVVVEQPAVVEDTVKVAEVAVKIDGRSKAAKQNKR